MNLKLAEFLADPKRKASLVRRFWAKVDKRGPDDCWPWTAKAKHPFGYGRMTAGRGVYLKAPQVAYALECGAIPEGHGVLHSCDNPPCCNQAHLFTGTQADNSQDMLSKGRGSKPPHRFGAEHHATKFDEATARKIIADARSARVVAAEHGVSEMTIYRLRNGKTWKALAA